MTDSVKVMSQRIINDSKEKFFFNVNKYTCPIKIHEMKVLKSSVPPLRNALFFNSVETFNGNWDFHKQIMIHIHFGERGLEYFSGQQGEARFFKRLERAEL